MTTNAPPSSRRSLPTLPTASALQRAVECQVPWTWGLRWHYEPSAAADFGTAVHKAAEILAKRQPPNFAAICKDLAPSERARVERCAAHVLSWLADQGDIERDPEQVFAYDVATGKSRVPISTGTRDYSDKRPGEIFGTSDLVWHGSLLTVDDYKTGRRENVEPIATNMQMRFLGLAAARAFGVTEVRVRLVFVSEDGIETEEATLDELDLCDVAAELSEMAGKLVGKPAPNPGKQCKYCPVVLECPATKATLVKLDAPMSIEITSPEHCGFTLQRLKLAKAAIEQIEKAAKQYVRDHGSVPIGNGKVYGVVTVKRETIDLTAPEAAAVVSRHLGEKAEDTVKAKLSLTKTDVERVLSASEARSFYADLRAVGAMLETEHEELKERKAS